MSDSLEKKIVMVAPEDISNKIGSKDDLYRLLTVDRKPLYANITICTVHFYLPPKGKCNMKFLRDVLRGSKKVSKSLIKVLIHWDSVYVIYVDFYKALKTDQVNMIFVPRFKELATKKVWEAFREHEYVSQYFPDYTNKQVPDRVFMWTILSSVAEKYAINIVHNARYSRSLVNEDEESNLIEITKEIYDQLLWLPS